jgi:hypothetical protein
MLDMTEYKNDNDALRAETVARNILSEELEGNCDISSLIGADEYENLWIHSSEEAKEAASRRVALMGLNDELGAKQPASLEPTRSAPTQDGPISNDDSGYGSLEGSLPAESKMAFSVGRRPDLCKAGDLLDEDDSTDIQSLLSVPDDIQSQVSTHRTQQEIAASEQLEELLARHEELSPLYEIALSKISKERLVGNLRRMLKKYATPV